MARSGKPSPILLAGGLLLLVVGVDAARRALVPDGARSPAREPIATSPAPETVGVHAAGLDSAGGASRRRTARQRIELEGAGTYLPNMLGSDSVLRRWPDERLGTDLTVAVVRAPAVAGFREDFVSNVAWAVGRWNGALLPVRMRIGGDSVGAGIVVTWTARLDSTRTGRASVTWDNLGRIKSVLVVLATHDPGGRLFEGREMVALALHELGHALGLDHSPVREDAMYRETAATELTERDLRTARLLYSLPPGSVRN